MKVSLYNYEGFSLAQHDHSFEGKMVYMYCYINDVPLHRVKGTDKCPENYVPVGSVEWTTKCLGRKIVPDFYPDWLQPYLFRKVWKSDEWILGRKLFVKPSDSHKRFTGFVTRGTYGKKKKPPFWYSEIFHFTNEWRYYVTNGQVLTGKWYAGDEVNTPDAPEIDIAIPEAFSGTLDFGTIREKEGKMALVEAHEPIACGWYGDKEDYTYLQWLVDGWVHMNKIVD